MNDQISRRELGRLAAALTASRVGQLSAQTAQRSSYVGPLTGITRGLEIVDSIPWCTRASGTAPRRVGCASSAANRREAEEWQKALRAKITELLGGFPSSRSPLRPALLETRTFAGYRREKVVFDSRDGVSVLAYVLAARQMRAARRRR